MVRLIIIDKDVFYRECIIAVLKSAGGFKVVGSFNRLENLNGVNAHEKNDLVLLNADDDIYTISKTINKARRIFPKIPILAYGGNYPEKLRNQITNQGVQSYFDTYRTPSEFIKTIKKTTGLKVGKLLGTKKYLNNNYKGGQTPKEKLTRLSNRELMVLKMIASGKSVRNISDELSLKISTVHTFRTRLMNKLKLKNNVEIALFAISNKIVNSPDRTG